MELQVEAIRSYRSSKLLLANSRSMKRPLVTENSDDNEEMDLKQALESSRYTDKNMYNTPDPDELEAMLKEQDYDMPDNLLEDEVILFLYFIHSIFMFD